jgi:hypothetical protein
MLTVVETLERAVAGACRAADGGQLAAGQAAVFGGVAGGVGAHEARRMGMMSASVLPCVSMTAGGGRVGHLVGGRYRLSSSSRMPPGRCSVSCVQVIRLLLQP